MEYTRTLRVGEAEIGVVFTSLPFKLQSRLDDMTSQMYFEMGGRRTGTNLELGRVKDIVIFNAVAPDKKGQRKVRFRHPAYKEGERVSIVLGDPFTLNTFPIIDQDAEYMSDLDGTFMREIIEIFPYLKMKYGPLFRQYFTDEEEEEEQVEVDPTESEDEEESEDGSTKEPISSGAHSNTL